MVYIKGQQNLVDLTNVCDVKIKKEMLISAICWILCFFSESGEYMLFPLL